MTTYRVTLARTFSVQIETDDPSHIAQLACLYVGYTDEATEMDKQMHGFEIRDIQLIENDVLDIQAV